MSSLRAVRLERALKTPAHIYYKYEGASPAGSHKVNTSVAQAFFNKEAGTKRLATETGVKLVMPPPALCTDNGAMIAWAGLERLRLGLTDGMDFAPRPRWPLDAAAERVHNGKA